MPAVWNLIQAVGVLVVLPTCTSSDASCSLKGASCMLPKDIDQWSRIPGFKGKERIWDAESLKPAMRHMGGLYHVNRLIDKMNRGQRILAVAIGSSYVQGWAGCWQTSLEALYGLGIIPNPYLYPQREQDPTNMHTVEHIAERCSSGGFMEGFMETLNTSWPNHGHVFLNHGKAAVSLWHLSEANCIDTNIPEEIDLLLLDPVTNAADAWTAEKLLRRFLRAKSEPLVILLSNTRLCYNLTWADTSRDPSDGDLFWACHYHCLNQHDQDACASLVPNPYPVAANQEIRSKTADYQAMAEHYDMPHLDLHELFVQTFANDSWLVQHGQARQPQAGGVGASSTGSSKWNLMARFYIDHVHPNKKDLGTFLVSDLLVAWMYEMQQKLLALPKSDRMALRAPSAYSMPPVIYDQARLHYRSRCFGVSFEQVLSSVSPASGTAGGGQEAQGAGHEHGEQAAALEQLQSASGDFFGGAANEPGLANPGMASLPPLKVITLEGWRVQSYYRSPSGLKFKPGYISQTAGAILEFEFDSVFEDSLPQQQQEALITYTRSYDGWGMAVISCVSGCTCEPALADAHSLVKTSLLEVLTVTVSAHRNCRMRVQVHALTGSTGHRFKVSAVMVRSLMV